MWIGEAQHRKHALQQVEILVNMFSSKEFDIVVQFDSEHLMKNFDVIDSLHTGTVIEFTGYITKL